MTYCAPAWSGACSAADRVKLHSFIRRSKRLGYCSQKQPSFTQLFDDADDSFFDRIKMNSEHVLQPYLPERPKICYSLRERSHNTTLLTKTALYTVYTTKVAPRYPNTRYVYHCSGIHVYHCRLWFYQSAVVYTSLTRSRH